MTIPSHTDILQEKAKEGTTLEPKKALIGMSGGVDSSVAAFLTKEAGFDCIGATMRLYAPEEEDLSESKCCSLDDVEDARSVARTLGIPFYAFNFKVDFARQVMDKFVRCYEAGLTPNPCIDCNRHLKFDRLLRRAMELGCEYVVTGHYAQIRQDSETGRYLLCKAADKAKDQTYFLACLNQEQLSHTLFPLGCLTKDQVRAIAQENGFINARKRDSQDICFVPDGDYAAFLSRYTGKTYSEGDYLDLNGKVLGKHKGAVCYTLGQRKGLGIALGAPAYVCAKDMQANTVTLGPNEALFSQALIAGDWNWYPFPALEEPMAVTAKIRHSQFEQSATVYPMEDGRAKVVFDQAQRAVTPGQAVVLYNGDTVVGGGTILSSERA